jgi:hypothetical protein
MPMDTPLSFPREVKKTDKRGRPTSEEYIIPMNAKKKVLEMLYPFKGVPDLNEMRYDLHEGRKFRIVDFKVVREDEMNYLVSPYYYESGGSVIDWMPAHFDDEKET